MVWLFCIN